MTTEQVLASTSKTDDALEMKDAVAYLQSIGVRRVSARTLYNRINSGTGPENFKRNGRLYFRKCDLDAWKKNETERRGAYE